MMKSYQYFKIEKNTVGFTATIYLDASHKDVLEAIVAQVRAALPGAKVTERTAGSLYGYILEKLNQKEVPLIRQILTYLLDNGWQPLDWKNADAGPFALIKETESTPTDFILSL
jgi:hypothetical protein